MEKQTNQNSMRNNTFFERYKQKVLIKEQKKIEGYLNMSGSRIMWDRIFNIILDYIGWIFIGVFVYVWWTTRAISVDCRLETCNALYNGIFENITNLIKNTSNNINSIPIGAINITGV